jgi:hypothetical protein
MMRHILRDLEWGIVFVSSLRAEALKDSLKGISAGVLKDTPADKLLPS